MWSWENKPYNSFGNGSAMRVSPVGFAFETEDEVLAQAKRSAAVTHNHPEGIKGAKATALSVFLARKAGGRVGPRQQIENTTFHLKNARHFRAISPISPTKTSL